VNIIAVRLQNDQVKVAPGPEFELSEEDILVVIGKDKDLKELGKI
jgi:trk system potassium uptake protein TrkA